MHPTLTSVAASHFRPLVDNFIADWWREHRQSPKVIDVVEWMTARHGVPHDDAHAIVRRLIRDRYYEALPAGAPAFHDEPLHDRLVEEVIS